MENSETSVLFLIPPGNQLNLIFIPSTLKCCLGGGKRQKEGGWRRRQLIIYNEELLQSEPAFGQSEISEIIPSDESCSVRMCLTKIEVLFDPNFTNNSRSSSNYLNKNKTHGSIKT